MGAGSLKENICSQPTPSVVGPTPTVIYGCTTGLEHHRDSRSCPNAMDRRTSAGYAIRKLGIYRIIISGIARGFTANPKMVGLGGICRKSQFEVIGGMSQRRGKFWSSKVGIRDGLSARGGRVRDDYPGSFSYRRFRGIQHNIAAAGMCKNSESRNQPHSTGSA